MKFLIPTDQRDKKPFKPGQLITVKHIVYQYVKCYHLKKLVFVNLNTYKT